MTRSFVLLLTLCAGCGAAAAPPASAPTTVVPAPGASAPDRQDPPPPPPPPAHAPSAACTSVLLGSIASHTSGDSRVPSLVIKSGERLCVEAEHESERITSLRVVEESTHADRTLVFALGADDQLQIDNPFDDLLLHYSLEPLPTSHRVCPAHPHETHVEQLPRRTAQATLSDLHFKGHGTAGSELCM